MKAIVAASSVFLFLLIFTVRVQGDKTICTNEVMREGLYSKDPQEVRRVLSKCIISDKQLNPDCKGEALCKPIIMAALNGSHEVIELLIDAGASVNVNGSSNSGDTPLIISIMRDDRELVKALVEHGADVNQKNNLGSSPFWGVVYRQDDDFIDLFVTHGADVNTTGKAVDPLRQHWGVVEGITPLMIAALNSDARTTQILLDNKAIIEQKDSFGRTVFQYSKDEKIRNILYQSN